MAKTTLERKEAARASAGGVLAGLISGLFLAALLVVSMAMKGQSIWPAFKGAAAPFFGSRVMAPGFDAAPVLAGTVAHFAISAGWGWLFAVIFYGLSRPATVLAGAIWGFVVWLGMHKVLLPLLGLGAMARAAPAGKAILEHVLFGLVLSLAFLPYQRRVVDRWPATFGRRSPRITAPR
ncbi:MAG TPA: hypothetical protein VND93_22855 [Myxococcales bacterium]|jgi:hypothetical protein|nr:hypothetical protein [Myxococcales bacterium]